MILTNPTTGESYYRCYPTFIANKLKRDRRYIQKLILSGREVIQEGEWIIFPRPEEAKQKKGFGLK